MKKYTYILFFAFVYSCVGNKGVYWCGDHPCINNKEKEEYFKKTMIVEVRNFDKKNIKKDSEIKKLLDQARIDEKRRILTDKELLKKEKLEEKEIARRIKLEEKKRKKEQKELAKQAKIEEKRRLKEEKELAKRIEIDEKKSTKSKNRKKEMKKKEIVKIDSSTDNKEISTGKFEDLVEKIIKRNSSRPFPEINDIPN